MRTLAGRRAGERVPHPRLHGGTMHDSDVATFLMRAFEMIICKRTRECRLPRELLLRPRCRLRANAPLLAAVELTH